MSNVNEWGSVLYIILLALWYKNLTKDLWCGYLQVKMSKMWQFFLVKIECEERIKVLN